MNKSKAVKKITTDEFGSTLVTVQWGEGTFVVEISDGGVVVAPVDKDGNIDKQACPSAWVDPFEFSNEGHEGEIHLLVHSYFNNEQEGPVTVKLTKDKAIVTGDGLPFAEVRN